MFKRLNKGSMKMGAALMAGVFMASQPAHATTTTSANNFGSIASNITTSVSQVPGLLSAIAYLFGVLIGVLGIMKIKDHVENPGQTPLKDGAIRLAVGGGLFSLPIIYEAMKMTVQPSTAGTVESALLSQVKFGIK